MTALGLSVSVAVSYIEFSPYLPNGETCLKAFEIVYFMGLADSRYLVKNEKTDG